MKPLKLGTASSLVLLLWDLIICVSQVAGDCSQIFEYLILQRHNEFRNRHGIGPLRINSTLTYEAQMLANKMKLENRLIHESPLGENLYAYWHPAGHSPDANKAVDRWYSEVKDYRGNYGHEPDLTQQSRWIHFTNMIWRQTTDIGIGCSVSKSEETSYLVVRYWPVGNVPGHYSENVQPMLQPSTQVIPYSTNSTTTVAAIASSQSFGTVYNTQTTTAKPTTLNVPSIAAQSFSSVAVQNTTSQTVATTLVYQTTIKPGSSSGEPINSVKPSTISSSNLIQSNKPAVYLKPASQTSDSITKVYQQTTLSLTSKLPYTKPNKYTTARTTLYQKPTQYLTIKVTYNKPNVSASSIPIKVVNTTNPPYSKPIVYASSSAVVNSKPIQILLTKPSFSKPNTYTPAKLTVYTNPTKYLKTTKKPYISLNITNYQKPVQYSTTRKPYYTSSSYATIDTTIYQTQTESVLLNAVYNPPVSYPPNYFPTIGYLTTVSSTAATTSSPQPAYIPPNRPVSQLIIHHGPYGTVFNQPIQIYNPSPYRPVPHRPNVVPVVQYYPEKPYQPVEEEKPIQVPIQMPSNSYLPILSVQPATGTYDVHQTVPPPQHQSFNRPPKPVENLLPELPMYSIDQHQQQQQQYQPPKPIVINTLPEYRPPQQPVYAGSSKPPSYEYKPTKPPHSQIYYYRPQKPLAYTPAKPINHYRPNKPVSNQTPKPNYQISYYIPPEPISSNEARPPQNNYYFPPKPVGSRPSRPPQSMYHPHKPMSLGVNRPVYSPHRPKPIEHIDPDSPYLNFDDHDADDLLETAFELADDYDKKDKEKDIENKKNIDKNANSSKKNEKIEQIIKPNEITKTVFRESDVLKKDDFENEKVTTDDIKTRKTKKALKSKQAGLYKKSDKLEKHNKSRKNKRTNYENILDV